MLCFLSGIRGFSVFHDMEKSRGRILHPLGNRGGRWCIRKAKHISKKWRVVRFVIVRSVKIILYKVDSKLDQTNEELTKVFKFVTYRWRVKYKFSLFSFVVKKETQAQSHFKHAVWGNHFMCLLYKTFREYVTLFLVFRLNLSLT